MKTMREELMQNVTDGIYLLDAINMLSSCILAFQKIEGIEARLPEQHTEAIAETLRIGSNFDRQARSRIAKNIKDALEVIADRMNDRDMVEFGDDTRYQHIVECLKMIEDRKAEEQPCTRTA